MIKELLINGVLYAKYQILGTNLFLKLETELSPGNEIESENKTIAIIQLIENTNLTCVGYLNLN